MADGYPTTSTKKSDAYPGKSVGWRDVLGLCAHYWKQQERLLGLILAVILVQILIDLTIPITSGLLVDRVIAALNEQAEFGPAYQALFLLSGATIGFHFFRWIRFHLLHHFLTKSMDQMLRDGFAKVQRFSADWHATTFAGATVRELTRGKWAFDSMTSILWNNFFPILLSICGLTALIAYRFPFIGLMFAMVVIFYTVTAGLIATFYVRPMNIKAATSDSAIGASMADTIMNNPAVTAFGAASREDDRFHGLTERWRGFCRRAWNRGADMFFIQKFIWAVLQFFLVLAFIHMVRMGRASPGDVTFILTANLLVGSYLRAIGDHIRMLQQSFSEIADIVEIIRRPVQIADAEGAKAIHPEAGQIQLENVTFGYEEGAPILYKDFSLSIGAGEIVGLVGPSGSGKSTFVKLIQRLYDVNDGAIRIDGKDISHVDQASLRRSIALVPQDPYLFHRSLAENIAYGRPDATLEEIHKAAHKAHAAEFIEALPLGYETLVGERGVKLSGGERQRVAIARAFLADAPIVIFDEATSSLDTITEKHIQDAMAELMKGRTTIIIAHRLSTVRDVDRILVFAKGSIVEQGNHSELMRVPSGHYRALHDLQMETEGVLL
ncbi:ABC transporter ATP-binding protein [Hyphomonas atlantica corrig.]|uniref:ABC transporter ATP-binding protein n=1 Tax=Hyphomonas atlantica TaxID=1280948 RepID=UPI002357444F|nr:ABC transporter ATP-binding protein [Hyphomonas atlantica]